MSDTFDPSRAILRAAQEQREIAAASKGAARFINEFTRAKAQGQLADNVVGRDLMSRCIADLAGAIAHWRARESVRRGAPSAAYSRTKDVPAEVIAYLTLMVLMRGTVATEDAGRRTVTSAAGLLGRWIEDETRAQSFASQEGRERQVQALKDVMDKKVGQRNKLFSARASLAYFKDQWQEWTQRDHIIVGLVFLHMAIDYSPPAAEGEEPFICHLGLAELAMINNGTQQQQIFRLLPEVVEWMFKRANALSDFKTGTSPMVCPPNDWGSTDKPMWDGGYLTENVALRPFIKTKHWKELEDKLATTGAAVLRGVNALQAVPFRVNRRVLAVIDEAHPRVKLAAGFEGGCPRDLPVKPVDIATNEEARKEWRHRAAQVHSDNAAAVRAGVQDMLMLAEARDLAAYPAIYMPHACDYRGRINALPTFLTTQGSDRSKGMLEHSTGKPLGATGARWLAIHGANLAGVDKVAFEDRIQWVADNEAEILAIAADPHANTGWVDGINGQEIDAPVQFLAFCFEWAGYKAAGEGYVSRMFVAQDGSCSGLQHFSAALRDPVGGAAVNLVPGAKPADVYSQVAALVLESLNCDAVSGTDDTVYVVNDDTRVEEGTKVLATHWLKFGVTRTTVKRCVMTLVYGSKEQGFRDHIMEDTIRPARKKATLGEYVDPELFPFTGTGMAAVSYLARLTMEGIKQVLTAAPAAMDWLRKTAAVVHSQNVAIEWTTPVGFPVLQRTLKDETKRVDTVLFGKLRINNSYREPTTDINRVRMTNQIAPNFVHSLDAAHMIMTVNGLIDAGVTAMWMIHDSFGTLAADAETCARVVREQFVRLYTENDVLADFHRQMVAQCSDNTELIAKLPPPPDKGDLDLSLVLGSKYCFA